MSADLEAERIRREYERREREIPADFYALHRPENLFFRHGQERALLAGLRLAGFSPLTGRRVLEIGCGHGQWFGLFEQFGAGPGDLAGIELDTDRCNKAQRLHASADIRCGDATALPWADATFDVVFQSTVFTSILDDEVRRGVAREMLRVLKPTGVVLWYDFRFNNPRNSNVRGIGKSEIRRLFPDRCCTFRRVTLAPPLVRRIVPWSWSLASLLEMSSIFNTHLAAVIRPLTS